MVSQSHRSQAADQQTRLPAPFRSNLIWALLGGLTFAVAMIIAYRPSWSSPGEVALALLPWAILMVMAVVLSRPSFPFRVGLIAAAIVAWAPLIFDDARWSVLSFALYLMCFTVDPSRPSIGIALAGLATGIWTWAWAVIDTPTWTAVLPGVVFAAGTIISFAMHRTARVADEQAALVRKLQDTRKELAESERERGALEERARMAGEIHDTLAQGFTSIVLLARAGQRSLESTEVLPAIERTAEENLAQARYIVSADHSHEFDGTSLHETLQGHVDAALPDGTEGKFRVTGEARGLPADIEVTLLRATQEALRNIVSHAHATNVDVTLSYLDDAVCLDVKDDGIGFNPGDVADRGSLTGGQGLTTLRRRVAVLSGELSIESEPDKGSVLSLMFPVIDQ